MPTRFDGLLHGLVILGFVLPITICLLASAIGGVIGGAFSVVGGAISVASQGLKAAVPEVASAIVITPDVLQAEAQSLLQPNQNPATMSPQDAEKEVVRLLPDVVAGGAPADQAKAKIIDIMAAQLKISRDDAAKCFDAAQVCFVQTKQQVVQGAEKAARQTAATTAHAALLAFFALLIGEIAAAIGGAPGLAAAAIHHTLGYALTEESGRCRS